MGDRGNVYLTNTADEAFDAGKVGIYVYTHWSGYNLPAQVQAALKHGQPRWGDDSYLTRILIDQLTKDSRDDLVGAGISLSITDNEYPITIVDQGTNTVSWAAEGQERDTAHWYQTVTFEELIKLPELEGYPVQHGPALGLDAKRVTRIAELEAELAKLRG